MHEVAVGDSKDVLERGDVALGLDVERELLAGTHHAVAEQVAVVLSRAVLVADDGQLLVNHHAETSEQGNLSSWTGRCHRNPKCWKQRWRCR